MQRSGGPNITFQLFTLKCRLCSGEADVPNINWRWNFLLKCNINTALGRNWLSHLRVSTQCVIGHGLLRKLWKASTRKPCSRGVLQTSTDVRDVWAIAEWLVLSKMLRWHVKYCSLISWLTAAKASKAVGVLRGSMILRETWRTRMNTSVVCASIPHSQPYANSTCCFLLSSVMEMIVRKVQHLRK